MNLERAVRLCREIESFAPEFGCHVALTGGCLYKDGERKDCDLVIYRIRQVEAINMDGLFQKFSEIGMTYNRGKGFCHKMTLIDRDAFYSIDLLFPEDGNDGSEYISEEDHQEPQTSIR